jgi:outer membrane receptor protein involved in Fe transport
MGNAAIAVRAVRIGLFVGLSCMAVARGAAAESPASTQEATDLEEIVVTGSHIRGADAAGSKLTLITREQIDASGYERIEDVLATVTQNLNRVNSAVRDGNDSFNYFDRGAEVQLRGLGVGTTLVLVNGQRQGKDGYQGSSTDVSSIPGSAVERIEILPEGSSALYGSDAIGGVVNIILRKDFEGFEARVRGATADGDANERTLAGLWGHSGSWGHVLLGLQYDDSRALACSARAYCATGGDLRGFGGSELRAIGGNPGTILDDTGLPKAAIPHGQDGTNLTAADLVPGVSNYSNGSLDNDILPKQVMRSAFLSAAYNLTSRWDLSVDGRFSEREFDTTYPQPTDNYTVPTGNAFNHLGEQVTEAYDITPDVGPISDAGRTETSFMSAGLKGLISREWQLRLSMAYSKSLTDFFEHNLLNMVAAEAALESSDPATALNIFGDGSHTNPATLAALRAQSDTYHASNVFTTTLGSVIADGPLITGPAGPVRGAVGGDFRREHSTGLNIADGPENRGREVWAGFVEFAVPLVAAPAGTMADRLDLSLAGRYDHYSDVGGSFNPKLGLSWRPTRSLGLRGNWGTSFRAPPFFWSNPDQTGDAGVQNVIDPKSPQFPDGRSRALLLYGPTPDMKPETSTAWSVGADMMPSAAPGLALSVSYFNIDYKGKIRNVGTFSADFLTQETQLASLITRNPTPAQLAATCKGIARFLDSIGDCSGTIPITVIIDARFRNLARTKTSGVDLALNQAIDTTRGKWAFGLQGTYVLNFDQQITNTAPVYDYVDTVGYPLKLRLAAHLSWSHRYWTVLTTVNYTGAYQDPGSARRVDSWTTVDLNVGYRIDGGKGWMAHTQCNLGVNNLFDQAAPFVDQYDLMSGNFGYDSANGSLLGRQVSLQFVKRWGR